jgi:ribosomal protein S18 acetylase RimI-like enzyme
MAFIRQASKEDRDAIIAFCRDTFDWGDYIEEVIDDWLDSSEGVLFVALHEGRPAGIARVAMAGPGEARFEGLRVDRQFRRLGLGNALTAACVEEARRRGARLAMITVDASNTASLSLSERAGFRRVARYRLLDLGEAAETQASGGHAAQASAGAAIDGVRRATRDDIPALWSLLPREFIFLGWEFVRWSTGLIEDVIRRGRLWVSESTDGPCAAAVVSPDEGAVYISGLCGQAQGMERILQSGTCLAALDRCSHAYLWCVEGGADEEAAGSAGFVDEARGEGLGGLFLLEMRLDQ